jgi:hypothetical protein
MDGQTGEVQRANFYAKYLAKGEAHIAQAEADRSDKLLIRLLSQDKPGIFPPSAPIQWYGCADLSVGRSEGNFRSFPARRSLRRLNYEAYSKCGK